MSYSPDLEIVVLQHLRNNIGREFLITHFNKEIDETYAGVNGLVYQDKDLEDTLRVLAKEGLVEVMFLKRNESDLEKYSKGRSITNVHDITKEGLQLLRSLENRNL